MITVIVIAVLAYLAFHLGHSHANYRHGRAHGKRGVNLFWSSARGPYITIPGPFGTRIGHPALTPREPGTTVSGGMPCPVSVFRSRRSLRRIPHARPRLRLQRLVPALPDVQVLVQAPVRPCRLRDGARSLGGGEQVALGAGFGEGLTCCDDRGVIPESGHAGGPPGASKR